MNIKLIIAELNKKDASFF